VPDAAPAVLLAQGRADRLPYFAFDVLYLDGVIFAQLR
jgi:hypothetical protein